MKNGISLEEFKAQLNTEAQDKVIELEKDIARMKKLLELRDKEAYFLFTRCETLTNGSLCTYCGLRTRCDLIRVVYDTTPSKGKGIV